MALLLRGTAQGVSLSGRRPLRRHQVPAFRYAMLERHPALFMEMRLGKCLVTIRRIQQYKPLNPQLGLKALIVTQSSAIESWIEELHKEGETDFVVLSGTK